MVDFDTSTPELRLVKNLIDAYVSLDVNNVEPLLSKNYTCVVLPECAGLPGGTKESNLQAWGRIFSSVNKVDMIYHEVTEVPGKVVVRTTIVFYTVFGTTLNYDTVFTYDLVEEDGKLKVLRCTDSADPQQRSALIDGTVKAAAERVAA